MIIGIPCETKADEHRVSLTPDKVDLLVRGGHEVLVEDDAGAGANFPNAEYERAGASLCTLVGEVFELLNLRNIASDISGYAQLSPEVIVDKNPHVILTTDRNAILDNPAFANVAAVRNGQVFDLNSTLLSVAGPRFVDGIEELAQLVYPALFR